MKHIVNLMLAVGAMCGSGCENNLIPTSGSPTATNKDTLTHQVTQGVVLTLSGMKDVYSIQDTISWNLVLENTSDATPFPLYFHGFPPYRIRVHQVGVTDLIFYAPTIIFFTERAETLWIGDSLSYRDRWSQITWDGAHSQWTTLRAFPGLYVFEISLTGSPMLTTQLTKYFKIVEGGNPMCAWLRIDFASSDTVKADFIVRNRRRHAVTLVSNDPQPMKIDFVHGSTVLFSLRYALPSGGGRIAGGSDVVIFPFRASKRDSTYSILKGTFDMRFTLTSNWGDLTASGLRFLP